MAGILEFSEADAERIIHLSEQAGTPLILAKDVGVYLMVEKTKKIDKLSNRRGISLVYAQGCNPDTDKDCDSNSDRIMGGDEGGDIMQQSLTDDLTRRWSKGKRRLQVVVTDRKLTFNLN